MSNFIQNVKSGFANMKELLGIILSDDTNNDGYDLYINSTDTNLAKTAQLLKQLEEEQESKRFSLFTKTQKKDSKKNFKTVTTNIQKKESSQNKVLSDVHLLENIEPEK